MLKLSISRVYPSLPMPEFKTPGAVAFDLYVRGFHRLEPGAFTLLPSNLIVTVPKGYALIIAARSSLYSRRQLIIANAIGIIDQDFNGQYDELMIPVINGSSSAVSIQSGERIAQAILVATPDVQIEETPMQTRGSSRGGFGTTGS